MNLLESKPLEPPRLGAAVKLSMIARSVGKCCGAYLEPCPKRAGPLEPFKSHAKLLTSTLIKAWYTSGSGMSEECTFWSTKGVTGCHKFINRSSYNTRVFENDALDSCNRRTLAYVVFKKLSSQASHGVLYSSKRLDRAVEQHRGLFMVGEKSGFGILQ